MSIYQQATIVNDTDNHVIYVPEQPPGTVLVAFNEETLGALLCWMVAPSPPTYDPENEEPPPQVEYLRRDEALPIFVELMGREPADGELP